MLDNFQKILGEWKESYVIDAINMSAVMIREGVDYYE